MAGGLDDALRGKQARSLATPLVEDRCVTLLEGHQVMTTTFINAADVAVGSGPYSMTTAEVNGDGKLDLLTAH